MNENNEIIRYLTDSFGARLERIIKRFILAIIILILALVVSNIAWIYAWNTYEYTGETTTTETVEIDGKEGIANYIGKDGNITNGTNTSDKSDSEKKG